MSENPYIRRRAQHAIGRAGRASETRLAKKLGGRLKRASGAMEADKGDIDLGTILMEAKSTTGDSMGLKHAFLAKIAAEAKKENKLPALAISFVDEQGRPVNAGEWVCVRLIDWRMLFAK